MAPNSPDPSKRLDDTVLSKGQRPSIAGPLLWAFLALSGVAIGVLYLSHSKKRASLEEKLARIDQLQDQSVVAAELRALLPEASTATMKSRIILNLGEFRDAESVPLLIGALDTPGVVRRSAARALAQIGPPRPTPRDRTCSRP